MPNLHDTGDEGLDNLLAAARQGAAPDELLKMDAVLDQFTAVAAGGVRTAGTGSPDPVPSPRSTVTMFNTRIPRRATAIVVATLFVAGTAAAAAGGVIPTPFTASDDPVLVDPHGGLEDLLVHRRLRTPQAPELSFADDPLRMMRAARFIARFGLEPDPDLVAAVESMRGRMEIVSAERVRDELSKLLQVPDCSAGLWFLSRTGLADEFLPELNRMQLEQDPIHHHKDVLAHTIAVVVNTDPDDLVVRLAALFHDVGKPKTRSFEGGGVSFHHHEVVGARMTRERMTALRYPNEVIEDVTQLVYLHLRIHTYAMGCTDKAVRRYVRDAGPLLAQLNHLQRCDCTTRNRKRALALGEDALDEGRAPIDDVTDPRDVDHVHADADDRPGQQRYSTVTDLARLRGWSTSAPFCTATW